MEKIQKLMMELGMKKDAERVFLFRRDSLRPLIWPGEGRSVSASAESLSWLSQMRLLLWLENRCALRARASSVLYIECNLAAWVLSGGQCWHHKPCQSDQLCLQGPGRPRQSSPPSVNLGVACIGRNAGWTNLLCSVCHGLYVHFLQNVPGAVTGVT